MFGWQMYFLILKSLFLQLHSYQNVNNLIDMWNQPQRKPYNGTLGCREDRTFRLHHINLKLLQNKSQLGKYNITFQWVRNQNNVNEIWEISSVMKLDEFADVLVGDAIREESIFNKK